MSQEIQELAYLLWEQAGRPYCDDDHFWRQAESMLNQNVENVLVENVLVEETEKIWTISSGALEVEGAGNLPELIDVFLRHANQNSQQLGETVLAICGNERVEYDTLPNLKRLGLWN